MEIDKGWFSGAHFDLIIEDDVQTEGCAGILTEEQYNEWLRDIFGEISQDINDLNEQMFTRGLAGSGVHTATEVIQRERSKKLARLLVSEQRVKKRALKLLRRFITPAQWQDYNSLGCFSQKDGKGRTWKFKKGHHYPIECDGQRICIDPEEGAPDADLLLQVWLEVIGGRTEGVLSTSQEWGVQYLTIDRPRHHGVLCGIT